MSKTLEINIKTCSEPCSQCKYQRKLNINGNTIIACARKPKKAKPAKPPCDKPPKKEKKARKAKKVKFP